MVQYILLVSVLVQYSLSQILPGTVPSLPNPTLEGCQKDALTANYTSNYTSTYAQVIDSWCGMYDDVLPCLDMSLPYTRLGDVSDWYLSMMFDYDIALNISEDMCDGWETSAEDMHCIERSRRTSAFCMKFQTNHLSTVLLQLYYTNSTENPHADVNACLYANYTANCMIKHMKYCSNTVRDLIHKYFKLLNGKCDAILYENLQEHRNITAANTEKRQQLAEKMKRFIEARRRTENNTIQLQETITELFNQTDAATENISVAMEMQSDSVLNLNSTEEISSSSVINLNSSANLTSMSVAEEIILTEMNESNSTSIVTTPNPKRKSRKRKPKKSRKDRVKQELRKLLGMVFTNL